MTSIVDSKSMNEIEIESAWCDCDAYELIMHSIHSYPAKFPAFIATKAFEYAVDEGVQIDSVADIFCGCGTVALESKMHGKSFWGCDINPVATLIARTKSSHYDCEILQKYYECIDNIYHSTEINNGAFELANDRLKYWYKPVSYANLFKLKEAIEKSVDDTVYKEAFLCLFSSILKATSRWLTKSIKPQIDPNKKEVDVWKAFEKQYIKFLRATRQLNCNRNLGGKVIIENKNFLEIDNPPQVDLIVSSPPYVTSYEYADLHQLSTLWLGYATDYRDFRKGSIGSSYNNNSAICFESLNQMGYNIVMSLKGDGKANAKVNAVARYYLDMQKVIHSCAKMINSGGMVLFVVGDTEYKGVKINNSNHLIECLNTEGFTDIKAAKRTISKGICVPYRDDRGKFSTDKTKRKVYHEEYIISGRIWH